MSQTPSPSIATTATDTRKLALAHWITQVQAGHNQDPQLTPLGGDAGFRRYFRYPWSSPLLAVDAPPSSEDTRQFVALAEHLRANGLASPRIIAADADQGFLLVEDFGDQLLYRALTPANADSLYGQAMAELRRLQACPDQPGLIPRYDRALLRRELELFGDWFVQPLLGYSPSHGEQQMLNQVFTQLEDNALAQPQVLVHRDYHSRNLILCSDGRLGIIDFQGALWGAITYDLVSLLKDCYKRWPQAQAQHWALAYLQALQANGQLTSISNSQFLQWFDWMGLQRHIKVLGIFARLHLRDGKPGYLQDLPLVLRYTLETASQYPQLAAFYDWLQQRLLPLAEQQAWYSDYRCAGDTP